MEGFLVTMDIEKVFDSSDHLFLMSVLKTFGFRDFMTWIETVRKNQEYCVINSGKSTQCFKLQRGARQGNPRSAYLFVLALEVLFSLIKNHKRFEGLEIFYYYFIYSSYADDTTFLRNKRSIFELVKTLCIFSFLSGL